MKTLTRAVAYNTVVQIIGKIAITIISLLTIGILARFLGVSGLGQYQTAFSFLTMFGVFADLGFFYIIVRDLSTYNSKQEKAQFFGNVFSIRILAALLVYGIAVIVGEFIYHDEIVKTGIRLLAVSLFLLSLQNSVIAIFQTNFRMDKTVISDILGRSSILLFVWLAFINNESINAVFVAYIIGSIINLAVAMVLANRYLPIKLSFDFNKWKQILREATPLGLALILGTLYFKLDSVMLSLMKTTTDVGIYAPAYKIYEVVIVISILFMNTVLPIYSRYFAQKDNRLPITLQKAFDALVIIAAPIMFGILALAPKIIYAVAGEEFLQASTVSFMGKSLGASTSLVILSLAAFCSLLSPVFSYLLVAGGKQKKLVLSNFILLGFNGIINYFLIPVGSYIAASWTTVATEFIVIGVMIYFVKQEFNLSVQLNKAIKAILCGFVMFGVLYFVDLNIFLEIIIGGLVYLPLIIISKTVNYNDMKMLIGKS